MNASDAAALFSSARTGKKTQDEWESPSDLLDAVQSLVPYGIELDPCTSDRNSVGADVCLTEREDGLRSAWPGDGLVYLNPPYSKMALWIGRVCGENERTPKRPMVLLIPARTDTRWWHALMSRSPVVCFIKGRLRFAQSGIAGNASAPFPSALVYLGPRHSQVEDSFRQIFGDWGWIP